MDSERKCMAHNGSCSGIGRGLSGLCDDCFRTTCRGCLKVEVEGAFYGRVCDRCKGYNRLQEEAGEDGFLQYLGLHDSDHWTSVSEPSGSDDSSSSSDDDARRPPSKGRVSGKVSGNEVVKFYNNDYSKQTFNDGTERLTLAEVLNKGKQWWQTTHDFI